MASAKLERFRAHKDDYFARGEHSPLTAEQRMTFHGLRYFAENPKLSFVVQLDQTGSDVGTRLPLETTDGELVDFVRAGRVHLPIEDTVVTLTVLKDPTRGRYFLPFRDATAGDETYELGRYLDPQERPDGSLVIDFNYAYNPYCAYGEGWSCPIPPPENVVSVKVAAGERAFDRHD
jgi:uncharacterized protein (DUF1684 family)